MKRHLTPSLLISLLALFVALGGTGYAVSKLPKNSVGSAQIKKNAITSPKVKDGTLLATDFKAGQLPSGASGAAGGALTGTFPNPGLAARSVGAAQLDSVPTAVVGLASDLNLADNTFTEVSWGRVETNEGGVFNGATPKRLTAPISGLYAVSGQVCFSANASGRRLARIDVNGTGFSGRSIVANLASAGSSVTAFTASHMIKLAAGDFLEMKVLQDSGSVLSLCGAGGAAAFPTTLAIHYLGPAPDFGG